LSSQYLNLTKNSSLAIAIGYMDVVATIGGISLMQTGKEMETMIIVLLTYLVFSLIISAFMNWFNSRMSLVER
jgi:general L-amino acid transport system permease protein